MTSLLPAYTAYKDIGEPWVGEVPSHWGVERGKWLFSKAQRPALTADETVTCFRDGVVTLRRNRRLRGFTEALKEIGYQGVRRGDLVIHAMDAFAGAIGVSDSDGKCSPVYQVCLPRGGVNAKYYAFLIREMSRSQWIMALAKGIRERSTDFRFETFGNQFLPVPPVAEQAEIVRYLAAVDQKVNRFIRTKRRLIEVLTEQKQAIITHAVTKGLNPHAPLKPSGIDWLGDVPEHWRVLPLKRWVSTKITDGPHETPPLQDDGIDFVSAESMVNGKIVFTRRRGFITRELHETYCQKCRPQRNDIFMCKSGNTTGKVALVDTDKEFSVWSPLALIRCKPHWAVPQLMFLVLASKYVQHQVQDRWSYGTQPNLSMAAMERIIVALPDSLDEQQALLSAIQSKTGAIDAAIDRALREIDLIREYRTRLVADVVTGKVDVRAAAASLPPETEELVDAIPDDDSGDEDVEVESVEEAADVAQ